MIQYFEVTSQDIEELLNEKEVRGFISSMYDNLELQLDSNKICIEKVAYTEGYVDGNVNGRNMYEEDYSILKKVVIYTENIANFINQKFYRISNDLPIIKDISTVIIKLTIAHELKHVWQFENGKLTPERIKEEKYKKYSEKDYEKEAIEFSKNIIGGIGAFENYIVEISLGIKNLNNETMPILKELYVNNSLL